jgi:phospholipid N-methyltransferase
VGDISDAGSATTCNFGIGPSKSMHERHIAEADQRAQRSSVRDHIEFFRQFRRQFTTTGAIAPSSRFLARAMTGPLNQRQKPSRILEVGPGTGAVTRRIVQSLKPEDRLDLVELNSTFAELLQHRFETEAAYTRVADQARIHVCPLEEFQGGEPYDFIISGLPLNNFPSELVQRVFEAYFRLLAPSGTLSYFEYMYVRPARKLVASRSEKQRLRELDQIIQPYLDKHRVERSWVFANLPPAWVQHLKTSKEPAKLVH